MNASVRRLCTFGALVAVIGLVSGLSGCSGASDSRTAPTAAAATTVPATPELAGLVGPGCAAYAAQHPDGAGSIPGMATEPLVTAAGNSPMLTSLTKAVSGELNQKINLVDTLNGGEFTVFAPVDTAFAQIPKGTRTTIGRDPAELVRLLTYHLVAGELTPAEVLGEQITVQGGRVVVRGSGNQMTVNGANVICGNIRTASSTIYLIDQVLDPSDAA